MSWLSRVRNGIPFLPKRQSSDNLWHKCKKCEAMVFTKEWEENLFVCPRCEHHGRIGADTRVGPVVIWVLFSCCAGVRHAPSGDVWRIGPDGGGRASSQSAHLRSLRR